jgi:hypothetical protein
MNTKRTWAIVAAAGALLLAAAACEDSDTVAPDGSTITLAATPATILVSNGIQATEVTILGTVRNSIGVPMSGQDVRYTTTSGFLTPLAGTPVESDDLGNAITFLNGATTTTTITAQSGKATATISLQTISCNIQNIAVDPSPVSFTACPDDIVLTATVTDTDNEPCAGILITFKSTVASLPPEDVALIFSPGSRASDANGEVTTTVSLDQSTCSTRCTGLDCNTSLQQIQVSGGGITAPLVPVNISIN